MSCTKTKFDIAKSETRITKPVSLLNNLNLNNYSFEFTPTKTSAGGTLLYIASHLSYKCRSDLNIYKKNDLESTFIEIVSPRKSNIIVGVIYRHPSMDLADFNCNYLNELLETRITSHSNTLIDNIFSNVIDPDIISGNFNATISDHRAQFTIILNRFNNITSNIYERYWSKFDRQNFILDYFSIDWVNLLKIE